MEQLGKKSYMMKTTNSTLSKDLPLKSDQFLNMAAAIEFPTGPPAWHRCHV